tara:strand:+ start:644 stop:1852 length:1209 start_codon:yes stop_codon:yes gene_type:complete
MGIGKFFKKTFKTVAKPFKKLGKLIGKGFKKFGKLINKAGIFGQIGMLVLSMYAGPWLSAKLGSFVGKMGAGLGKLAEGSGFLSKAANVVLKGAQGIAKAGRLVKTAVGDTFQAIGSIAKGAGNMLTETLKAGAQKLGMNFQNPADIMGAFNNMKTDVANSFWDTADIIKGGDPLTAATRKLSDTGTVVTGKQDAGSVFQKAGEDASKVTPDFTPVEGTTTVVKSPSGANIDLGTTVTTSPDGLVTGTQPAGGDIFTGEGAKAISQQQTSLLDPTTPSPIASVKDVAPKLPTLTDAVAGAAVTTGVNALNNLSMEEQVTADLGLQIGTARTGAIGAEIFAQADVGKPLQSPDFIAYNARHSLNNVPNVNVPSWMHNKTNTGAYDNFMSKQFDNLNANYLAIG